MFFTCMIVLCVFVFVCRVLRQFCLCRSAGGSTLSSPLLANRTQEPPAIKNWVLYRNAHTRSSSKCVSVIDYLFCPIKHHRLLKPNVPHSSNLTNVQHTDLIILCFYFSFILLLIHIEYCFTFNLLITPPDF